ncbi:MAG: hypothetical protein GY865_03110, partial [candidate division Zixibacteria bacterium]|nr:hypothetical protein [candidate division Zixibacteria bacterium]
WVDGEPETVEISADTVSRSGVVAPLGGYSVMRVKQDIFENSNVGLMLTYAGQESVHPAVTGGFDWRLKTNDNTWGFKGQAIFSKVESNETGYGLDFIFEKLNGKHVRGYIGATIKDPKLDLNRLGYTSRNNAKQTYAWLQYRTTDDWWIVRNSYNNLNFESSWNYDGVNYNLGGNFNTYIEFTNFWSLGGGVNIQAEKYSDRETRDNYIYPIWEWPVTPTASWWFSLNTDYRKKLSFNWNPGGGADRGGSWWANYVGVTYRPRSNMEFELGVNLNESKNATRWVRNENDTTNLTFAELDMEKVSLFASASIVANKNLSIQLSAEGLISGLDYSNYRLYQGDGNYSDPLDDPEDKDYNFAAINSTLIMRWEYSPGSTVYIVWTRALSDVDRSMNDLAFSRDFKRLFTGDANNLFLIKASKWLNI